MPCQVSRPHISAMAAHFALKRTGKRSLFHHKLTWRAASMLCTAARAAAKSPSAASSTELWRCHAACAAATPADAASTSACSMT